MQVRYHKKGNKKQSNTTKGLIEKKSVTVSDFLIDNKYTFEVRGRKTNKFFDTNSCLQVLVSKKNLWNFTLPFWLGLIVVAYIIRVL